MDFLNNNFLKKLDARTNFSIFLVLFGIIFFVLLLIFASDTANKYGDLKTLRILSSNENRVVSDEVSDYALAHNINIDFIYKGDLDIVDELNKNSKAYDAVWISNSMWLYMLDNSYLTSESKSLSISPVVFGIKMSKAKELGLVNNKNVTNNMLLDLIKNKKIKYVMNSVTQTNSGATAYLGFLSSLLGNPEIITVDMLNSDKIKNDLKSLFSGVERVSGDESYLEEMFLNDNSYEAIIDSESSLINMNQKLKDKGQEQLYLIYPSDGVAINDSTFAFINSDDAKKESFLKVQSYLLSDEGQKLLENKGQRTWYGGVSNNSNSKVFNKSWGIDTSNYLNVTKFPSKKVITAAINLYIEKLRKPTHVVFCLDYSGSMYGDGVKELTAAMNYILDYNKASHDKLQFSKYDKITVITFSNKVNNIWNSDNGRDTIDLINKINAEKPNGATALYDAVIKGLDILSNESDDYTKTIIAMTDGQINVGSYYDLSNQYFGIKSSVPIYSITFGSASEYQLEKIAKLSNAKVFDGKKDLLKAFKDVRGYN